MPINRKAKTITILMSTKLTNNGLVNRIRIDDFAEL